LTEDDRPPRPLPDASSTASPKLYLLEAPDRGTRCAIVSEALSLLDTIEETLLADGAAVYDPGVFAADLEIVFAKMTVGIAPAERVLARSFEASGSGPARPWRPGREQEWSHPIDWRSVLNGGYVWYLAGNLDADSPVMRAEGRRRRRRRREASALLQGAVELSENHTEARRLRRELRELEMRPG
jgi:hypothetical protein